MKRMIKYVAGMLNIQTDSELIVLDMTEELVKIRDVAKYRAYLRKNLVSPDVEYQTGFQKFIILTDKYLSIEEDIALAPYYAKGEIAAKRVSDKVKQVRVIVEDEECGFKHIRLDGDQFFTDKELISLAGIGSTQTIIDYSRTHKLTGELYKAYIASVKDSKKQTLIAAKTREMIEGME